MVFTVTVNPIPNVTVVPNPIPPLCSGETTNIALSSLVQGTTFTWVVVQPTFGVSGFSSNQTGNVINDVLTATGLSQGRVTYRITPNFGGCTGPIQDITVFVNPRPTEITYTPPAAVCSGSNSSISINVFEANTILKWTSEQFGVTGASNNTTGVVTSGSYTITDTLTLSGNTAGYVIYTLTPFLNGCSGTVKTVRVDVVPLPQPKLTDGVICIEQESGNTYQNYILNSQLSSIDHSFVWEFNGGTGNLFTVITGATGATYEASQVGTYRVKATSLITGCISNYSTAIITSSFPAQSMNVEVTNAFTDNATITVTVVGGTGQYMYQLGDGNFQNSNIFENVAAGVHVVKVIDTQGCTYLTQEVTVIHYMQFFTPNGDGYNDVWKINNLNQPDAKIYIFDRNGKLLKQISGSENAQGWNGTFNGKPLPASDYWFTIEYKEKDITRTFKAHFTLKR
jgi:gliding motility-associated-like protein